MVIHGDCEIANWPAQALSWQKSNSFAIVVPEDFNGCPRARAHLSTDYKIIAFDSGWVLKDFMKRMASLVAQPLRGMGMFRF
jgi:hypothetical protein